jgi:hypothetical protein
MTKFYYNKKYKSLTFLPDDFACLRLYNGYSLVEIDKTKFNQKLEIQRVGPFRILRSVGRNAYELKIGNVIDQFPSL